MAKPEPRVHLANKAASAVPVHLEYVEILEPLEGQDRLVLLDSKDSKDNPATRELPVPADRLDHLEILVLLARMDLPDR